MNLAKPVTDILIAITQISAGELMGAEEPHHTTASVDRTQVNWSVMKEPGAPFTPAGCPIHRGLIAMSGVRSRRTLPPLQILQHPFPQHPVHPRLIPLP